jgi:hypothetical protein
MIDGWDVATAIGTVGSAVFVAIQAWYTRRALKISRDAMRPAEAVAIEASRARFDAEAPRIEISLTAIPSRYMVEPSSTEHLGGRAQPFEPGRQWHFPRDDDQLIVLRATVYSINRADNMVYAEFEGPIQREKGQPRSGPPIQPAAATQHVPARSVTDGSPIPLLLQLEARFTAKQWAENYEAQQRGSHLPFVAEAKITYTDGRDEGVVDVYRLWLTGCPIEPVPTLGEVWRERLLRSPDGELPKEVINYDPYPPRKRQYWISRSEKVALPSPTYGQAPSSRPQSRRWWKARARDVEQTVGESPTRNN